MMDDFSADVIDAAAKGKPLRPADSGAVDSSAIQRGDAMPYGNATATRYVTDGSYRTMAGAKANAGTVPITPAADDLADFSADAIHKAAASVPSTPAATAAPKPASSQQITSPEMDLTAHVASGLASSVVGGVAGAGRFLWELGKTGSLDKATDAGANVVRSVQDAGTYQPRTPQGQQMVEQFGSKWNPLNWPAVAGDAAGGALADAGLPGAGALVNAGTQAAAPLLIKPAIGAGTRAISSLAKPAPVEIPRVEPTMDGPPRVTTQDGTVLQPSVQPQPVNVGGASANAAPVRATAPVTARPEDAFPEVEPTDNPAANPSERLRRAQVLNSVGITTARDSSLTGDRLGGSTDLQLSKVDSNAGRMMQAQIESEKQALANHAGQIVEQSGGSIDRGPNDATALNARGETILDPLNRIKSWFDNKAGQLYDAANERAQGQPVQLDSFRNILSDDSEMTSPEFVQFRDAAKAFAKKNGLLQDDGTISGNALQAETMRKWLNAKRTYGNGPFVDGLKEALDTDVMSSAGEDLYQQARALWTQKKNTLDNPDGIAKLMQAEGPDGINRPIPIEQVAPRLARMPAAQFGHVVDTLKNAPPEVQPSAQAALNAIRSHFANEVRNVGGSQQGQWNAKGVTQYLRENALRLNQVFTPEEMAKFQNLSEAGQIVAKDQSYPGAAAQAQNLGRLGVSSSFYQHAATGAGTVAGGIIAGAPGAAVGASMGRAGGAKLVQNMSDKASSKAVQQRLVPLSDLLGRGK